MDARLRGGEGHTAFSQGLHRRRWGLLAGAVAALSVGAPADQGVYRPLQSEYVITGWSIEEGLPQSSVTSLAQTRDGYLWVGTFGGLARFDGLRFEVMDGARVPGLPSPAIVALHRDALDRLWVGTDEGTIVRVGDEWDVLDAQDGWRGTFIGGISEGPDGRVVIRTANGEWLEAPAERRPGPVRVRSMIGAPQPVQFTGIDGGGGVWGGSDQYVGWNPGSGWAPVIDPSLMGATSVALGPARDGSIWVLWDAAVRRFAGGREVARIELPTHPGVTWDLYEDSRGNVWIATEQNGLWCVSPSGEVARWDAPGPGEAGIRLVREDDEGNVWVGTLGAGLHRFTPRRVSALGGAESSFEASSVCPDGEGGLWIGTWGRGILHWDEPGGLRAVEGGDPRWHCRSVVRDSRGRLWVGVVGGGVFVREGGEFRSVPVGGDPVSIVEDTAGRIWVSTTSSVHVFGDAGASGPPAQVREIDLKGVRWMVEAGDGRMWLATPDEVLVSDGGTITEEAWAQPLVGSGRITCFTEDRLGTVWLMTNRAMHRQTNGRWESLPFPGGSAPGPVGAVSVDERGFYWLSCARALVRIHGDDLGGRSGAQGGPAAVQVLGSGDGLPSAELASGRQPVQALDDQGRLWVCTLRGVAVVDTRHFEPRPDRPSVVIEGVDLLDWNAAAPAAVALSRQQAAGGDENAVVATLPPGSRDAQVRFNAISLGAPERLRFQVRIGGDGSAWTDVGSARSASLVGVGPGIHMMEVRAASGDGVWSERPARLLIDVRPHAWETAWFRAMAGVAVLGGAVGAVGGVMRARHRRERERLELKHKDAELVHLSRVAVLGRLTAALSHELNQPLTAILSNAQAAQRFMAKGTGHEDEVREILSDIVADNARAAETIRRLRGLFKRDEQRIEEVDVGGLIAATTLLVRGDAILRHIELDAEVSRTLPTVRGDRVQLQQVLINLLINAFEALDGAAGVRRVIVRAGSDAANVVVEVLDSGPGLGDAVAGRLFEPFVTTKTEGMGMGLSICRTIVEAHGGKIVVRGHGPLGGAMVVVTLPVAAPGTGGEP